LYFAHRSRAVQRNAKAGEYKANTLYYAFCVDEGRKRVLLIAATILAARKLAQFDKPCPGIEAAISNSVGMAEKIMAKIDAKYPEKIKK
jgi:hypothetical protein